ncbi:MAG: hypothetical protein ACPGUD_04500 [Parashewanella sp.]
MAAETASLLNNQQHFTQNLALALPNDEPAKVSKDDWKTWIRTNSSELTVTLKDNSDRTYQVAFEVENEEVACCLSNLAIKASSARSSGNQAGAVNDALALKITLKLTDLLSKEPSLRKEMVKQKHPAIVNLKDVPESPSYRSLAGKWACNVACCVTCPVWGPILMCILCEKPNQC